MKAATSVFLAATMLTPACALGEEIDAREVFEVKPLLPFSPDVLSINPRFSTTLGTTPIDLGGVPTNNVFASVGRGYDPISGKILDKVCVSGTEPDSELGNGTIVETKMGIVRDVKSHQSASGSSLGFSAIIKTVSIGFGSSEARGNYFNSVDQFARIYSRIVTKAVERRNVKWSKDAQDWVRHDMAKFLAQCGTRYVRGVYSGHLLDMSVHFALREDQKAAANATSLSIGVAKLFGASLSMSDAEKDVNAHADAKLTSLGVGAFSLPPAPTVDATPTPGGADAGAAAGSGTGTPAPAPGANPQTGAQPEMAAETPPAPAPSPAGPTKPGPVETLIDYYNTGFRPAVMAAQKDSALPLYIIVDDYWSKGLPFTNNIPSWTEGILQAVIDKEDALDEITTYVSDNDFAGEDGVVDRIAAFYRDTDKTKVDANAKNGLKLLNALKKAMLACKQLIVDNKENPPGGKSAISLCSEGLDAAAPAADIAALKLKRNYAAPTAQAAPAQ